MSAIKLSTPSSGSISLSPANTASNFTVTIPAADATMVTTSATQTLTNKTLGSGLVMGASAITSGTAVTSTSGTSIDFTSIPSWVKRITVMFNGVSTNGTSVVLIQLGSGSVTTSGYFANAYSWSGGSQGQNFTTGFGLESSIVSSAADIRSGLITFANISGNIWVASGTKTQLAANGATAMIAGNITLSGTLDRIRITTVNGTDTFDAGSINILYE